jgi:hypothetical protein
MKRISGTIVASVVCASIAVTAGAEPKSTDLHDEFHKAPGVLFTFNGGPVGQNFASVLLELSRSGNLPVETYTTASGDNICIILTRRGYPPPCEAYYPVIDNLNKELRPIAKRILRGQEKISLPAPALKKMTGMRVYTKTDTAQRQQAEQLAKNWKIDLNATIMTKGTRPSNEYAVVFDSYEFLLPTDADQQAIKAFERVVRLRSSNTLIDLLLEEPLAGPRFFGFPGPSQLRNACLNGTVASNKYDYEIMADADIDARSAMQANLSANPQPVTVHVIDTVLHRSPALRREGSANFAVFAASWQCKWEDDFVNVQHHATHLAHIIRSRAVFEGLAPTSQIKSFEWWRPSPDDPKKAIQSRPDRAIKLAEYFSDTRTVGETMPVYLVALELDDYKLATLVDGHLPNAEARITGRRLEEAIKRERPLLIVAAGDRPIPISATAPHAPQNLGDLENVLVVTACVECARGKVSLFPQAYFNGDDKQFVHVAAPGGMPTAGWIDVSSLGAGSGTSQASAFVAGLVAKMLAHFYHSYREPRDIKYRIQVTSRPISPTSDGASNPDADKITAGVVDPTIALLDPTKHWVKASGGSWRAVKIRKWSSDTLMLMDQQGYPHSVSVKQLLRLTKTYSNQDLWSVYYDRGRSPGGNIAEIGRIDLIQKFDSTTVEFCDDAVAKTLTGFDDLIIRLSGVASNECDS